MTRIRLAAIILTLGVAFGGPLAAADKPILIDWEQLLPKSERAPDPFAWKTPKGIVQHGAIPLSPPLGGTEGGDPLMSEPVPLVNDYDGKIVRIAGFVVPFDFDAGVVKEFLLVPYVGACIHVPPPPANQIIFVSSKKGIKIGGLFDAVWVTGTFTSTQPLRTELAEVGYQLTADKVEVYKEK